MSWNEAAEKVKIERATWYAWAHRRWGILDPHSRCFWSRKQFRTALVHMPTDHPDRWAYKIGARYAPAEFWVGALSILVTVALCMGSIILSVRMDFLLWAIVWPSALAFWGVYFWKRWRALST